MINLYIQIAMGLVLFTITGYLFRSDQNMMWYMLVILVVYACFLIAISREYRLIKYIKNKYPKFYSKYEDKIGKKFWLKELKTELTLLNDDFINDYTKNIAD